MWLPLFLKQLNEAEMQAMGMKITAEDIYSINKGSLKDAIVSFGGFCTGEIISNQGLVLTNHHCGYGQIQSHSSLENNYLEDGFWAKDQNSELQNPGLFVTFIVSIQEVTEMAMEGVTEDMAEQKRQSLIDQNIAKIRSGIEKEEYQDLLIRPFFKGNQYFLFVTETYKDVRLVGAPPSSIGKFGADTDNWVWPRHTGDFSMFRIYASPDNKPAAYSPDNVPFTPKHFLPISLDGVAEEDFTLVFGFPGRTNEYLPSPAMEMQVDVLNPIKIGIRDRTLEIIDQAMREDPQIRIQYASKQARIANAWKKWIGESQGVKTTKGVEKKQALEAEFQKRVDADPELKAQYGDLLDQFKDLYSKLEPYAKARDLMNEIAGRNIELFQLVNRMVRYERQYDNNGIAFLEKRKESMVAGLENFYKNYQPKIDQQVLGAQLETYFNQLDQAFLSDYAIEQIKSTNKDYDQLAALIFQKSMLPYEDKVMQAVEDDLEGFIKSIKTDYAYLMARRMVQAFRDGSGDEYDNLREQIDVLQRKYMKALMEVFPEKKFYPDANGTMRITYGKVNGYTPKDAVYYQPVTYLSGVMEKYQPGDYEFDVPEKLRELYENKDYGQYAEDGKMPVCFIGSNHTTGGNSGSPAIDAYGNLVGLNFDRVWEGTMSDINYDASICRNIMVDIRYILFIVDKLAGAEYLVEEMKLVHPKG